MTNDDALKGLQQVLETGNESDVLVYVKEHFGEFSEEAKQKILLGIMSETMQRNVAEKAAVVELKEDVLQTLRELDEDAAQPAN